MEHWLKDEANYFDTIKHECNVVFDVGASYSPYIEYPQEVHYFDPQPSVIEYLKSLPNSNSKSFFNNYGLSDVEEILPFYRYGDFVTVTSEEMGRFPLKLAKNYIEENNIKRIDFLKLDIEGFELKTFKGFGDHLNNVKYIQFEYGTCLRDIGSSLLEVVTHLKQYGFDDFGPINTNIIMTDFTDTWEWANIRCVNKKLV